MKPSTKRILIVTRNFPPLMGGMERLLYHVYLQLAEHYPTSIVGPLGCTGYLKPGTLHFSCPTMPPWSFLAHFQFRSFLMAKRFQPDLIISGSGVTAPAACSAGAFLRIPVLCFTHGLDLVVRNGIYRMGFIPFIRACQGVIVNSRNTATLAVNSGIDPARICILHPGVHIPDRANPPDGQQFRDSIHAGSRPILLSVGRLTERKGIVQFIDNCLPEIAARNPDVLYVLIGDEPRQALNGGGGTLERIYHAIRMNSLQNHVLIIRDADDQRLWQAYTASQLLIFPVIERSGDVEGFGMVAVEAAAHGLPTIAFATGGIVDAVKDGASGYLLHPGDYAGMTRVIQEHLTNPGGRVLSSSCLDFSETFSWDQFGQHLKRICSDTVSC